MWYLKTVLWAFFGIRRSEDAAKDAKDKKPLVLFITAIVLTALFVGTLVLVARCSVSEFE